jgi:hypothetical protein
MPDGFIERTTAAVLRDAFRVETQVPNAPSPPLEADDDIPRIPYWLYGQKSRATAFSRDDLRKMSPDARL